MKNTIYFLLLLFTFSCGSDTSSDTSTEAAALSEAEITATQKKITDFKAYLEELQALSNHIQVQGRALTPEEISFSETVGKVTELYEGWNTKWEGKTVTAQNGEEWVSEVDDLWEVAGELEEVREMMEN